MKVAERTAELRTSEAYLSRRSGLTHTGRPLWRRHRGGNPLLDEHSRLYGFDPEQEVPSFEEFRQRVHPGIVRVDRMLKRGLRKAAPSKGSSASFLPAARLRHLRAIVHPVFTRAASCEFVGTVVDVTSAGVPGRTPGGSCGSSKL